MCRSLLFDLCLTATCILVLLGFVIYTTQLSHNLWASVKTYAAAQAKQAAFDVVDSATLHVKQSLFGNKTNV